MSAPSPNQPLPGSDPHNITPLQAPIDILLLLRSLRISEEDRVWGRGGFVTGLMCSPSTQAKVLILGQLSFQRSTEAITPSHTFIREGRAGAPQASTVVRRRLGSAVEVEDSMLKRRSSPNLTHPETRCGESLTSVRLPFSSRTPFFPSLPWLPSQPGVVFFSPQYWVTF